MKFNKAKVKAMVMEQFSEQSGFDSGKLEELLEDLLAQLSQLDLSIDYLAAAVTGDDPLNIAVSQGALGRVAGPRPRSRSSKMQETKNQLKKMIEQAISEQDTPETVKKAVESDESMEELLAAMAERMSELESEIEILKSEYSNASARMGQITGKQ